MTIVEMNTLFATNTTGQITAGDLRAFATAVLEGIQANQDAISNLNLSELEKITEGANTGWRLLGSDPANYGDIGNNAIDISSSSEATNLNGATGNNSLAAGINTMALGEASTALGKNTLAELTALASGGATTISTSTVQHLLASDPADWDNYGTTVAINETHIAIGVPLRNSQALNNSGAVYIYDIATMTETIIEASDCTSGASFGVGVALSTNKLAVAAVGVEKAYVYNLDGTGEVIIPSNMGVANKQFGFSIAIDETKVAVGARYGSSTTLAGAVGVFNHDGTGGIVITASGTISTYARFGERVKLKNNKLYVLAGEDDSYGSNWGSVWIMNQDGTGQVKVAGTTYITNYGDGFDVSSTKIVFGDQICNLDGTGVQLITPPVDPLISNFGETCTITEDRIIIGDPFYDMGVGSLYTGAVFIYDYNLTLLETVISPATKRNGRFGMSMATNASGYMLVGAGYESIDTQVTELSWTNYGAAYLYGGVPNLKVAAIGIASHKEGYNTVAQGMYSHAEGNTTVAQNDNMHAAGKFNTGTSPDTIHETGIGIDHNNRANAFEIYTDGKILAPSLSMDIMSGAPNTALVTKEFFDGRAGVTTVSVTEDFIRSETDPISLYNYGYGYSVAVGATRIAVATGRNQGGTLLVYDKSWNLLWYVDRPLYTSEAPGMEGLKIEGNYIYVGYAGWVKEGKVEVYDLDGVIQFTISDTQVPELKQFFGESIGLNSTYIAVAQRNATMGGYARGAIHLFNKTTGAFVKTLQQTTPTDNDSFGSNDLLMTETHIVTMFRDGRIVSIDIATGAETFRTVTEYASWPQMLLDEANNRFFIGGSYLLTGVGIYNLTDGTLIKALDTATYFTPYGITPLADSDFAGTIGLSDNYLYLGVDGADNSATPGEVLFYDRTTFEYVGSIYPTVAGHYSFSSSITVDGTKIYVGAQGDVNDPWMGNIYEYDELNYNINTISSMPAFLRDGGEIDMLPTYVPTNAQSIATKSYVDNNAGGTKVVQSLPVADLTWFEKAIYVIDDTLEYVCVANTLTPTDADCFWLVR